MSLKQYLEIDVLTAARERVEYAFDHFQNLYVSFSGGKDSTVMLHLVGDEARMRNRRFGILIIDLEAQYRCTIQHIEDTIEEYRDCADIYWVCLPLSLRNAISNFEPRWCCWEAESQDKWVRKIPDISGVISDYDYFDFFVPRMEFEEFMVLFGIWYGNRQDSLFSFKGDTAAFVGIRCDESLNRFRTIASSTKEMHGNKRFTTKVEDGLFNIYPIYDWRTEDIWRYKAKYPNKNYNPVYDMMHKAGLSIHQMRLCQPYGDDQKRGLWLYHILEPETWYKVVSRVSGANSGALYIQETGNITGYNRIDKPDGHTWKSFCNLLLKTMPRYTREHYIDKFRTHLEGWAKRGYNEGIPDEAPKVLENKKWVPSWRRLCKVLLRNDWWCKGLGLTQPKSQAYVDYMKLKKGCFNG